MNNTELHQLMALLEHIYGAYAPNTIRAYKADMMEFIAYCQQSDLCALPTTPTTLSQFLLKVSETGIKTATIERKISSISAVHRLLSYQDPTKHPEAKICRRKILRKLGSRPQQAYPINRELLRKMVAACGDDLRGLRDKALLLVAYESMKRRSELISLRIEDIETRPDGNYSVLLRRSKTDQKGSGKWINLGVESTHAVKRLLDELGYQSGKLFRGIRPGNRITEGLCDSQVSRIYKGIARKINLEKSNVSKISGHSMRVGGAQDALIDGLSLPQIMVKGGWVKTDTVLRYIEKATNI